MFSCKIRKLSGGLCSQRQILRSSAKNPSLFKKLSELLTKNSLRDTITNLMRSGPTIINPHLGNLSTKKCFEPTTPYYYNFRGSSL
uniref:Uncharacterized protein n=1 Tax=Ascaris lumbricoides TaxID=6252 RepID=A0A0M3I523_ASCLU